MPVLGSFLLLASFVMCAYAISACVAGARRRSPRLIESGIGAFYFVTALMTVASGVMVHAFVTNNYNIKYVSRYSEDRKSTRLNSSHLVISYAVFCMQKKTK